MKETDLIDEAIRERVSVVVRHDGGLRILTMVNMIATACTNYQATKDLEVFNRTVESAMCGALNVIPPA